jgi:hypothetical protein
VTLFNPDSPFGNVDRPKARDPRAVAAAQPHRIRPLGRVGARGRCWAARILLQAEPMTIRLHAINLLVPIHLIEARYPGGLEACIDDHESLIGDRVWFDGAPSSAGIRALVDGWTRVGLQPVRRTESGWHWDDLCVVTASRAAPTLPCEWLRLSPDGNDAWWAHAEPGPSFGPEDFVRAPAPRRAPPRAAAAEGWGRRLLDRLVGSADEGLAPAHRRA